MVSKIIIFELSVYLENEIDLYLQVYLMYIKITPTRGQWTNYWYIRSVRELVRCWAMDTLG